MSNRRPLDLWLTPREVAEELRVKADVVRDLIHAGRLEAIDVARPGSRRPRFRVSRVALQAYVESRRVRQPIKSARRRRRSNSDVIQFFT